MIKFGFKPAMAMSLADSDDPVEQLKTIIDFAKAATGCRLPFYLGGATLLRRQSSTLGSHSSARALDP